jgi:hypothetical protein
MIQADIRIIRGNRHRRDLNPTIIIELGWNLLKLPSTNSTITQSIREIQQDDTLLLLALTAHHPITIICALVRKIIGEERAIRPGNIRI